MHRLKHVASAAIALVAAFSAAAADFRVATFETDVTSPIGGPLLASMSPHATGVKSNLWAKGVALLGGEKPVVIVSVDWCEIRNDAYDAWRDALADAAGTTRDRVLVTAIHQHDAPLADLEAQRILEREGIATNIINLEFHRKTVARVADSLRAALKQSQPITHIGIGRAKVDRIAANRRYIGPDGKPRYDRGSSTKNIFARNAPEEMIDPWLKALSFWNGDHPVAVINSYAVHPMSYYRTQLINPDFPGIARARRQADLPGVMQIYVSGASGNVTAGKYNDGARDKRAILAQRLYDAMSAAWKDTKRTQIERIDFRSVPLRLEVRNEGAYTREAMIRETKTGGRPRDRSHGAMGLSWRHRAETNKQPIDVPIIDFGPAAFLLLPGESYVEFQLYAQTLRPKDFIMVAGYGESAPGYIPLERNWEEKDANLNWWCWVAPGSEARLKDAIRKALTDPRKKDPAVQ